MNNFAKRIVSFILAIIVLSNSFYYYICAMMPEKFTEPIHIDIPEDNIHPEEKEIVIVDETKVVNQVEKESTVYEEVSEEPEVIAEPEPQPQSTPTPAPNYPTNTYTNCLTKRGGVYWNPNTGLKETWYSQRVLPGGGLNIPGRHVNEEGFVCDADGYICVASSDYAKGTVLETSRGIGKVYDCGCASGTVDLYTDW